MKKICFALFAYLFAFSLSANTSAEFSVALDIDGVLQSANTPGAGALKFFNAIKNGTLSTDVIYSKELDEMYKDATPGEKKIMDSLTKKMFKKMCKTILQQHPEFAEAQFSVVSEKIVADGKTAVVKVKAVCKGESSTQDIYMVKSGGKWKLDIEKWK